MLCHCSALVLAHLGRVFFFDIFCVFDSSFNWVGKLPGGGVIQQNEARAWQAQCRKSMILSAYPTNLRSPLTLFVKKSAQGPFSVGEEHHQSRKANGSFSNIFDRIDMQLSWETQAGRRINYQLSSSSTSMPGRAPLHGCVICRASWSCSLISQ